MKRLIVGVLLVAGAAGCGGSSDPAESSPGAADHITVPTPDGDQRAALLAGLRKVDSGLVANEDRAVSRSRDVCSDIIAGKPDQTLAHNAELRFEGGTVADLTAAQATQIVSAIRSSFCS